MKSLMVISNLHFSYPLKEKISLTHIPFYIIHEYIHAFHTSILVIIIILSISYFPPLQYITAILTGAVQVVVLSVVPWVSISDYLKK